ncbi:hypothetical protein AGMMS4957_20460 [Bacteroidia bacterium]|nr:hypothetical protein AGMMS4957_20460 [Bacteroidia bacterium]
MNFKELIDCEISERDKYISRVFGVFSEKIAEIYFKSGYSEYESLGRPTLYKINDKKGYTLDFTLKNRKTSEFYICEMKCELQYENCKYLELSKSNQIKHHEDNKKAFQYFLDIPQNASNYRVEIKSTKEEIKPAGIILLWGKISNDKNAIDAVKTNYKITEILSLEDMINTMVEKNYDKYFDFVKERIEWSKYLFDNLLR